MCDTIEERCEQCEGDAYYSCGHCDGAIATCRYCKGTGQLKCPNCDEQGFVQLTPQDKIDELSFDLSQAKRRIAKLEWEKKFLLNWRAK